MLNTVSIRRCTMAAGLIAYAIVLSACHRTQLVHGLTDSKCKDSPDATQTIVPLTQTVEYLQRKYPGCIAEIADVQNTNATTWTTQQAPTDGGACGGSTTLRIRQYKGGGGVGPGKYGDDDDSHHGLQRGYVLALIENTGACAAAGRFSIPAGTKMLWVVDHPKNEESRSHFVYYSDDTKNLNEQRDWKFHPCGHTGISGDTAMFRKVGCDDTEHYKVLPALAVGDSTRVDPFVPWMNCGGDCCTSSGY